jgi:phosphopantetheine--protein transferase-like protein
MTQLVRISAHDTEGLVNEIQRTLSFLDRVPHVRLQDVAYTCSFTKGKAVIVLIVKDISELRARLSSALDRIKAGAAKLRDKSGTYYYKEPLLGKGKGKLAFVYASVMGFYPNLMRDLVIEYPVFRYAFDELEEALSSVDQDFTPSNFAFPPAPCYRHDADVFSSGAYSQALVTTYTACKGMNRLLKSIGIVPDGAVGFGGGDFAAIMCSGMSGGSLSKNDRITALRDIYKMVNTAVDHSGIEPESLYTVIMRHDGDADKVIEKFPQGKCTLMVDFSPRQRTYALDPEFEEEALAAFSAAGIRTVRLDFDMPFNTPKCKKLVSGIKKFLMKRILNEPKFPLYSCASAARFPTKPKAAREEAANLWAYSVEFKRTVEKMYEDGYRVFLEVGPRGLMTSAVEDTLKGKEFAAVATNSTHRTSKLQLLHAIGQLIALGAEVNTFIFYPESSKKLDFDSAVSLDVRKDVMMKLSRTFPKMTLLGEDVLFGGQSPLADVRGHGAKAAQRAAAQARKQRQFDWGVRNPLISDAEKINESPGVTVEIRKNFRFSDIPLMSDFALGTSQISYSDPNLRGLVIFPPAIAMEIMAEVAQMVVPNLTVHSIVDFSLRRWVKFKNGELGLVIKADRVACSEPTSRAVKVQIRNDSPDSAFTWPIMECTVIMGDASARKPQATMVDALVRPRNVHWSGRDIYPTRICYGRRLRGVRFVEAWSEEGIDYEVEVPPLAGNVTFTRFPMWAVNPALVAIVSTGFTLWRSHENFVDAFSFPFRVRKIEVCSESPVEGAKLKCYLRLTGVTPRSHLCDITVSDGNGKTIMRIEGWEELAERIPQEFRNVIMQPATGFLSKDMPAELLGDPDTDIASAYMVDPPYETFERHENLWLEAISSVVLSSQEHTDFGLMTHNAPRLTEWLYGRIAAKEAVRRYLRDNYQARWSNADVDIYKDESGKPKATGEWKDSLTVKLDIAIAHTARFIIAIAAANAKVGVDVESTQRDLSDEFAAGAFTDAERDLAASASQSSQALIRFWCAKESVSKALGTGLRYSPKDMNVTEYQPDTGRITIRLSGSWVEAFSIFKGRDIVVSSRVIRDHALAFCYIPTTLLSDDD